jgi:phosphoglycolate phosphatase
LIKSIVAELFLIKFINVFSILKNKMKLKAIIFDVDDTLINTSEFAFMNMNKAAKLLNLKPLSKEQFLKHWGHTTEKMVSSHWPDINIEEFNEAYEKVKYAGHYPAIDGAMEVLDFLKDKHYLLGILTSRTSDSLPKRFKQINISLDCFKFIQYADETDIHKPNPEVFRPILEKFRKIGIKNEEILYIGDHLYDAKAALPNNLNFLGVLSGTTKKEDFISLGINPDNIINSIRDLPDWLKSNRVI